MAFAADLSAKPNRWTTLEGFCPQRTKQCDAYPVWSHDGQNHPATRPAPDQRIRLGRSACVALGSRDRSAGASSPERGQGGPASSVNASFTRASVTDAPSPIDAEYSVSHDINPSLHTEWDYGSDRDAATEQDVGHRRAAQSQRWRYIGVPRRDAAEGRHR
ncbi:hypothetical protein GCM10018966_095830 [Streptomyces yanii]